jgi:hypothetical protein
MAEIQAFLCFMSFQFPEQFLNGQNIMKFMVLLKNSAVKGLIKKQTVCYLQGRREQTCMLNMVQAYKCMQRESLLRSSVKQTP